MTPYQEIYDVVIKRGYDDNLAKIIVGQSYNETGNWTSNAFKKHNNAFGYTYVKGGKWQTGKEGLIADNNKPVADYKSVSDSTNELIDWLERREKSGKFKIKDLNTPEKYAQALKDNSYYGVTVSHYLKAIQTGIRLYSDKLGQFYDENKGVSYTIVAISTFAIFYLYKKIRKK
jgi:uncharacterized FlgJ-related protein